MNVERAEELAKAGRRVRPSEWRGGWIQWSPEHGRFADCTGCHGYSLGSWGSGSWVVLRKRGDSALALTLRCELRAAEAEAGTLRAQLETTKKLYQQVDDLHGRTIANYCATVARLEDELEQSAAQDNGRCQQLHGQAATIVELRAELALSQELCGIRERKNQAIKVELADALDTLARLSPAPEAPAAPVEVWHACSASEAREKHAAGMRVRLEGWTGWQRSGEHFGSNGNRYSYNESHACLVDLCLTDCRCSWAEPLAEAVFP